jgi:hypothetical protein
MNTFVFRWMMMALAVAVGGGLAGSLCVLASQAVYNQVAAAWPLRRLRGPGLSAIRRASAASRLRHHSAAPRTA